MAPTKTASVSGRKTAAKSASRTASKTASKEFTGKNTPDFGKDEDLHAYREMLLIRRFEEKAGQLYGMGFIGGFCHLYIGQEAVVLGLQLSPKETHPVIP